MNMPRNVMLNPTCETQKPIFPYRSSSMRPVILGNQ